jgi:transmembrane sensor
MSNINGKQGTINRVAALLYKRINKEILSQEEKNALDSWLAKSNSNPVLLQELMDESALRHEAQKYMEADESIMLYKLHQKMAQGHTQGHSLSGTLTSRHWWRYAAAAILLIMLSTGVYLLIHNTTSQPTVIAGPAEKRFKNDVAPGTAKALLTLADGTTIDLYNLTNGTIARQGNAVIINRDGLLAYNTDNNNNQPQVFYNTITIPAGGEYKSLVLADGTKVWLNSLSSIHFPTTFVENSRRVEITGEAYFEVAPSMLKGGGKQPFIVHTNRQEVEVLGTHFDINAYPDEGDITTTLLEGAVKIVAGQKLTVLKPNQQARVNEQGNIKVVDNADTQMAIAWKQGVFNFKNSSIETIMRQVARWYNVTVTYSSPVNDGFFATIPKNVPLTQLLKLLELTGEVHFSIDGKKVTVGR